MTDINTHVFRQTHRFAPIPKEEEHRIHILHDLLNLKHQYSYFEDDQFTIDDINQMIEDTCTS